MKKFISIFLVAMTLSSCKKYENGPAFSLLSKKERVSNTWTVLLVKENGVDKTNEYKNVFQNYKLIMDKNNMKYTLTYKLLGLVDYSETGSWDFSGDKLFLVLKKDATAGSQSSTSNWKILKLKEKELWIESNTTSSTLTELHLVP